jgi:hypothetical protein
MGVSDSDDDGRARVGAPLAGDGARSQLLDPEVVLRADVARSRPAARARAPVRRHSPTKCAAARRWPGSSKDALRPHGRP